MVCIIVRFYAHWESIGFKFVTYLCFYLSGVWIIDYMHMLVFRKICSLQRLKVQNGLNVYLLYCVVSKLISFHMFS